MTIEQLLQRESYRSMDLSGWDFAGYDLSQRINPVDSEEQELIQATQGCLLRSPDDYDPNRAMFRMPGRDFYNATLDGAIFDGANLANCNFACVRGARVSFRGANLRGAIFPNAHFEEADFTDADLSGITFT